MTTNPTSSWSESLQQQTRQTIKQIPVTPDGHLHFKHPTMGYAYATIDDLIHDRLVLRSKTGSDEHRFAEVEALLQAGWAVDSDQSTKKHHAHILKIKAAGPAPVPQTLVAGNPSP